MKMSKNKTLLAGAVCALAVVCLGGCAAVNATAPSLVGTQVEPVAWASEPWDESTNCLECHDNMNRAVEGDLGANHVLADETQCIDCHVVNDQLKAVHEGQDSQEIGYQVDSDVCLDCHTWDEAADRTADSQAITLADGTAVNPHTVHPEDAGVDLECTSCHAGHGQAIGVQGCFTCHHTQTVQGCADCHRDASVYADYLVSADGESQEESGDGEGDASEQ